VAGVLKKFRRRCRDRCGQFVLKRASSADAEFVLKTALCLRNIKPLAGAVVRASGLNEERAPGYFERGMSFGESE
jgi:hypothetical protein